MTDLFDDPAARAFAQQLFTDPNADHPADTDVSPEQFVREFFCPADDSDGKETQP